MATLVPPSDGQERLENFRLWGLTEPATVVTCNINCVTISVTVEAFEWIEPTLHHVGPLATNREVFTVRDRLASSPMELSVLKRARSTDALEGLGRELTVLTDASHPALRAVRASAVGYRGITLVLDHLVGAPLSQCRLENQTR